MVNRGDAALAQVDGDAIKNLDFEIYQATVPLDPIEPVRDMKIVMRGRTSEISEGTVKDAHFSYSLPYPGVGEIGFIDQVRCTRYAKDGAPGALAADKRTDSVVGLHCGGSSV